jgi:hypothetical protein
MPLHRADNTTKIFLFLHRVYTISIQLASLLNFKINCRLYSVQLGSVNLCQQRLYVAYFKYTERLSDCRINCNGYCHTLFHLIVEIHTSNIHI